MDVWLSEINDSSPTLGAQIVRVGETTMSATSNTIMTLLNNSQWIDSALEAAVFRAETPSLKLYHVLDLIRLVDHVRMQLDPLRPEGMAIVIAAILHPFISKYHFTSPNTAQEHADFMRVDTSTSVEKAAELFYKRWQSSKVKTSISAAYCNPSGITAPSILMLIRKLPSDGCPLFYFGEESHCFRPRLNAIRRPSGSAKVQQLRILQPRVLQLLLSEFTAHILSRSDPLESHARILELQRWKYKGGFRHQFILLHCVVNVQSAMLPPLSGALMSLPEAPLDFWLRIERSADRQNPGIWRFSSVFPPDDKVRVAFDARHLIYIEEATKGAKLELLSRIQYKQSESQTSVHELARILDIFQSVSTSKTAITLPLFWKNL
ncbi:hypothetical protein DL93DRAFT_1725115 [Clavulina sp. PMI_390]|nr:hypothetical protein DL93DRAFT_1725115 [Clavulina sp. PMI_390]